MAVRTDASGLPVVVKGKNLRLPAGVREYALKKASKLSRFLENHPAARVEVAIGQLRGQYTVEVTLQVGGLFLRGASRASEAQAAVDEAVDRAERQFLRFKARQEAKNQQAGKGAVGAAEPGSPAAGWSAAAPGRDAGESEEASPRIVRVKRFALKPMTLDEAVEQLEMLGHDFFVFTNAATRQINVLYRRHDGNLGLIEPEA